MLSVIMSFCLFCFACFPLVPLGLSSGGLVTGLESVTSAVFQIITIAVCVFSGVQKNLLDFMFIDAQCCHSPASLGHINV